MKRTFNTVLLFFFVLQLYSQSDYVKGTITLNDNTIVQGFIDYKQWGNNPKEILFKSNLSEREKKYTVKQLKGFNTEETKEFYKRSYVKINNEPVSDLDLKEFDTADDARAQFNLTQDTVFLLTLIEGELSLYWLKDPRKEHFFVQKNNDSIAELIFRKYIIHKETGRVSKQTFEFRTQLQELTKDCPNKNAPNGRFLYNYKEIMSNVLSYNECKGNTKYVKLEPVNKNTFSIFASCIVPFTTIEANNYTEKNRYAGLNFNLGVAYDIGFARNKNKMGLSFEAAFQTFKSLIRHEIPFGNETYYENYNNDIKYLRLSSIFRRTLPLKNIQPYFKLGVGVLAPISVKSNLHSTFTFNDYSLDNSNVDLEGILAIGAKFKKFYIESRVGSGTNICADVDKYFKSSRIYLTIGYNLK